MTKPAQLDPATASPKDFEQAIDARVQILDAEIKELLAKVEEKRAERKDWMTISGGRSRAEPAPAPDVPA